MIGAYTEKDKKGGKKKGERVGEEAGGGVGEAELKGWGAHPGVMAQHPCRKQTSRGAKEAAVAAPRDGELVPAQGKVASLSSDTGRHSSCPRVGQGHPRG